MMKLAENQVEKNDNIFVLTLGNVIAKFFGGRAKALADEMGATKSTMSQLLNNKRVPSFDVLNKLRKLGVSVDYLLTGAGNELVNDASSLEEAQSFVSGRIKKINVSGDRMAPTLYNGDVADVMRVSKDNMEAGSIYYIHKSSGQTFFARMISETGSFVYDNSIYPGFEYKPEDDDEVYKLIQKVSYHFPLTK